MPPLHHANDNVLCDLKSLKKRVHNYYETMCMIVVCYASMCMILVVIDIIYCTIAVMLTEAFRVNKDSLSLSLSLSIKKQERR